VLILGDVGLVGNNAALVNATVIGPLPMPSVEAALAL
jgi:hypothetical protein